MALTQDPSSKQNYYSPDPLGALLSADLAGQGSYLLPSVRPLGPPRFSQPVPLGKEYPNVYIMRQTLYEARGNPRQVGEAADHSSWAASDLVCDDQGILRLAFLTTSQGTPDPTTPARHVSANALGRSVSAFYSPGNENLYTEHDHVDPWLTDPTILAEAGYAAPASVTGILCLARAQANSVQALLIGYETNTAGLYLQAVTNLQTWAATNVTGAGPVNAAYGVIQTNIDGDSLLLYSGQSLLTAPTAQVSWGAMTWTSRATGLPTKGYIAGISKLGGSEARVHLALPIDSGTMGGTPGSHVKHISFNLRGSSFSARDHTPSYRVPWLTYITQVGEHFFACDGTSHFLNTGRTIIPVDKAADYAPNSDFKRQCLGHWTTGDKVFYLINEVALFGSRHTYRVVMEYDVYLNTVRQVSRAIDVGTSGVQSVGGPNMPYSEQTFNLHDYTGGSWYAQYQPPTGLQGYAQRKTGSFVSTAGAPAVWTAAASGGGLAYEPTGTYTSPALDPLGGEWSGARYIPLRAGLGGDVNAGGAGAKVQVSVGGQTVTFSTGSPQGRIPFQYFNPGKGTLYRPQASITATQQSGGTDPTHFTPNCFPVYIDYAVVRPSLRLPAPSHFENLDSGNAA